MQRYSEYKDSGVKWLGEIPNHWNICKAKYLWTESNAISEKGSEDLLSVSQYDGVIPSKGESRSESLKGYKIVNENNLVINIMLAWLGGLGVSKFNGIVSPAYGIYKMVGNSNPRFLHYLYKTPTYLAEFARRSTGVVPSRWRMYTDDFGQVLTLLPPKEEQDKIVEYLDGITFQIDKAIAQQQKMIDLLNERKQIIINNAVTKGIDPDVKMKDSGVEWIGEIPEHWEVKRGKFLFKIINELSTKGDEELLSVSDKTGVTPRKMKNITMFMSESLIGYKKCRIGDVCSNIMWMWHGAVGVTKYEGVISPSYGVYRQITRKFIDEYLDLLLRLPRLVNLYSVLSTGLTQSRLRLYPFDFLNISFFIPSLNEQQKVLDFINSKCKPLDGEIIKLNKLITLLQERKQIIINDIVTGKVKIV